MMVFKSSFKFYFRPQKVWESTNRLKNSPVALPSYIGVKDEAMLAVDDTNRYHGHTKQMMTEGIYNFLSQKEILPALRKN